MLALGMPQQFRVVILHRMAQVMKWNRGISEFVGLMDIFLRMAVLK